MKRKKAFTLLELVIVLTIITVLLLVAIPGAKKIKESANQKADLMNKATIKEAATIYCVDNGWENTTIEVNDSSVLVKEGYLESAVKSPLTGSYYKVEIKDQEITVQ